MQAQLHKFSPLDPFAPMYYPNTTTPVASPLTEYVLAHTQPEHVSPHTQANTPCPQLLSHASSTPTNYNTVLPKPTVVTSAQLQPFIPLLERRMPVSHSRKCLRRLRELHAAGTLSPLSLVSEDPTPMTAGLFCMLTIVWRGRTRTRTSYIDA